MRVARQRSAKYGGVDGCAYRVPRCTAPRLTSVSERMPAAIMVRCDTAVAMSSMLPNADQEGREKLRSGGRTKMLHYQFGQNLRTCANDMDSFTQCQYKQVHGQPRDRQRPHDCAYESRSD